MLYMDAFHAPQGVQSAIHKAKRGYSMKIAEIMNIIESHAPLSLAMSWDNCGLLAGSMDWEADSALITLDVTPNAVAYAVLKGYRLIISHHPLIFRPISAITDPLLLELITRRIAVICLHTNLDVAPNGVNHALANALGMSVVETLSPETGNVWHHISVTVPPLYAHEVQNAAWEAGAGRIGNYSDCGTEHPVEGSFRSLPGSDPFIKDNSGVGGRQRVEEVELEFMADKHCLNKVLAAIRAAHPYETPAMYHYPVSDANPAYGLGLVCALDNPISLKDLAELCQEKLGCPHPVLWTAGQSEDAVLQRVAVCGGAGGSVLRIAGAKADAFISGDISYHNLLDSRIPVIDAGHFYTEYPALNTIKAMLAEALPDCEVLPVTEHEYSRNHSVFGV